MALGLQGLVFNFQLISLAVVGCQLLLDIRQIFFSLDQLFLISCQLSDQNIQVKLSALAIQTQEALSSFSLLLQGLDLALQLVDNVFQSIQIILSLTKLAFRFLTTCLILKHSSSFFKDCPTFLWLAVEDFLNLPLGNDGEGISSQSSIHEEIMDIAQTDLFAVNLILTITAAVNVTLHPNLIGSILDKFVTVVQNHYHGCVIKRLAGFCSRKNHIGHLAAP